MTKPTKTQIAALIDFQNGAANHGDRVTVELIDRALEQNDPQALKQALQLLADAEENEKSRERFGG